MSTDACCDVCSLLWWVARGAGAGQLPASPQRARDVPCGCRVRSGCLLAAIVLPCASHASHAWLARAACARLGNSQGFGTLAAGPQRRCHVRAARPGPVHPRVRARAAARGRPLMFLPRPCVRCSSGRRTRTSVVPATPSPGKCAWLISLHSPRHTRAAQLLSRTTVDARLELPVLPHPAGTEPRRRL